ncbi:MAG TPA: hypothetical protein VM783_07820 [Candidatus Acidoferrum sp.]|nr:hypothetical protein [Candidatus Acidoferrum sp.]
MRCHDEQEWEGTDVLSEEDFQLSLRWRAVVATNQRMLIWKPLQEFIQYIVEKYSFAAIRRADDRARTIPIKQ